MITLRENQGEPIRKAIEFFKSNKPKPSLIVLPTAWGKSILTAYVAAGVKDKILVVQPSKELLEQNYAKYNMLCGGFGEGAGIYSASFGKKEIERVTYATIGSIKKLGPLFKSLGFTKMLIDEAHLYPRESDSMLGTFLKESGITHVLGITATPVKLQQNYDIAGNVFSQLVMLTSRSKKGNFFKEILHVGQVDEMVRLGYWSKLRYHSVKFDDSALIFNSTKSEYTEESVQLSFERNDIKGNILKTIKQIDRKHILAFVPSVADAKEMAERTPSAGVVYAEQPKKDRARVIDDFRAGRIRVLFNVRALSAGFDYTGIDCVMLGISTASIALYYQIVGRGTRIDSGKDDCLIVDFGGNVERFGKVEDIRYEQDSKSWKMYGTGGVLLSGIPVHQIGSKTKEDVQRELKKDEELMETMPFGKYKEQKISEIPIGYRKWVLDNFEWTAKNMRLKRSILATIRG